MQRVLIVEDEPAIRVLLFAVLGRNGFACDAAIDGAEAIAKIRRHTYDVILLDLLLPNVNGFEVMQFVRAERAEILSRIVVMTSADRATLLHFDGSEIRTILAKPIDIQELVRVVGECAALTTATLEQFAGGNAPSTAPGRVH